MHQSRTPLVRRLVASAIAAAALSTPVIVEIAGHAHAAPARGTHAVAMPDCIYNWSPICDRWDVHEHPNKTTEAGISADPGTTAHIYAANGIGTVGMFDCTRHWAPICGTRH